MQGVLVIKGYHGLTGGHLIKYQALLLDFPELTLKICHTLNPATLMPAKSSELTYSCLKTLDHVYACRSDLTVQAVENQQFADGSSFVRDGVRRAGYTIVSTHSVTKAKPLPPITLAHKAELIDLTQVLTLGEGYIRSDQIRSVAQLCPTLCDPMNRSTPGLLVHHQLPEFT